MTGLSDGRKSFPIGLAVLIQYRSVTATQPASHVAVAITLYAKASSLKRLITNEKIVSKPYKLTESTEIPMCQTFYVIEDNYLIIVDTVFLIYQSSIFLWIFYLLLYNYS